MKLQSLPVVARTSGIAMALGVSLLIPAATAAGSQIGPGTGIANDELDSAGGRINVDQGSPLSLPAGTYIVTTFSFDAGPTGDVTPFVAVSASGGDPTNLYTAVAVGNTVNVTSAAQDQTVPFGGSATFTLDTPRVVYAGISSSVQNPVFLDNGTAANTDHEGGGQTMYAVTVGGQVPPDGNFSNAELGRSYAFSVNVELVPEPSAGLAALSALGLCALRRRPQRR